MKVLLRTLPMALVYAVLAGPAEPLNWLVGIVLGLGLAFLLHGPGASAGGGLRLIGRAALLPWFLLGCLERIASGSWTMIRVLGTRRGRAELGFVRCRAAAETDDGAALLALVDTASPGSIVTGLDGGAMRTSLVPADRGNRHCDDQRAWYRRFQQRMLP